MKIHTAWIVWGLVLQVGSSGLFADSHHNRDEDECLVTVRNNTDHEMDIEVNDENVGHVDPGEEETFEVDCGDVDVTARGGGHKFGPRHFDIHGGTRKIWTITAD